MDSLARPPTPVGKIMHYLLYVSKEQGVTSGLLHERHLIIMERWYFIFFECFFNRNYSDFQAFSK